MQCKGGGIQRGALSGLDYTYFFGFTKKNKINILSKVY
jgi:hypothetical protein